MNRRVAAGLLFTALLLAGCGSSGSVRKQAEEVESLAAEGALLAHDAAEGDTTNVFTRVHAGDLGDRIDSLEPRIRDEKLRRLARGARRELRRLERQPSDETGAMSIERALERAAETAGEIAAGG
jgi:hypothetical protein